MHRVAWFIEERNVAYVDRRDQFEFMKYLQMFEYSGVDRKCPYIHQSYRWTGISIFIIRMLCIVCEYLSWSGTILCCYLKQSATRHILKEIHVSENSYPRRGIFSSGFPVYKPIVERSVFTARRYASAVLAVVVCPSVCLSPSISLELHARSLPIFLCMLLMAVAQSTSGMVTRSQGEGAVLGVVRVQSSNWTSDLFSTYGYIFNVN